MHWPVIGMSVHLVGIWLVTMGWVVWIVEVVVDMKRRRKKVAELTRSRKGGKAQEKMATSDNQGYL